MYALLVLYVIGIEVQNLISWENCEWSGIYGWTVQITAKCTCKMLNINNCNRKQRSVNAIILISLFMIPHIAPNFMYYPKV